MNNNIVDIKNYNLDLTGINLEEDYQRFSEQDWLRDSTEMVDVRLLQTNEGLVTLEFTEEKGYLTVSIDSELKKIIEQFIALWGLWISQVISDHSRYNYLEHF